MTEDTLRQDIKRLHGCWGIETTHGLGAWIDEWLVAGGDKNALNGLVMVVDRQTKRMTMWVGEIFPNA